MKQAKLVAAFAVALIAGLTTTSAEAQTQPASPPPPETFGMNRSGFLIGFGLGAGAIAPDCSGCDAEGGLGLEFHIGGMLNPRLGLMLDVSTVIASFDDGSSLDHDLFMAAAQYWATPQLWLKGGVGLGRLQVRDGSTTLAETGTKLGLLGAAGYEVVQGRSFALDLSLRVGLVQYDIMVANVAFMVGFNWY